MLNERKQDRRQVCLSRAGRAALLEALRKRFPNYPKGVYPDTWRNVTRVDQRTVAKILQPDQRVRQASINTLFKDFGAEFHEDAHLEAPSVNVVSENDYSAPSGLETAIPDNNRASSTRTGLFAALLAVVAAIAAISFFAAHFPRISVHKQAKPSAAPIPTHSEAVSTDTRSEVLLYDHFTADKTLDLSLWSINGPAARAALPNFESPPAAVVDPKAICDEQNGLSLSGVDDNGRQGGIQSVESFSPPFTVTALCNATSIHGDALRLALSTSDGRSGVSLGFVGGLGANGKDARFICAAPHGLGLAWSQIGEPLSPLPPAYDIWYVLAIAVDTNGRATAAVSSGDFLIGKASTEVGKGPFYVILAQGAGSQRSPGPNQSYCGVIQVISKAEE
jgi:hypothetical protein